MAPQKQQTRRQLDRLIARYPAIGQLTAITRPKTVPQTLSIRVQRADAETMLLRPSSLSDDLFGLHPETTEREQRFEHLAIVGSSHRIIRNAYWRTVDERLTRYAKDFLDEPGWVNPNDVEYLLWISRSEWSNPPAAGQTWDTMGERTRSTVSVTVFLPPRNETFAQLADRATLEKKAREEAYLHAPRQTPELSGLMQALRAGGMIRAISAVGVAVVRVQKSARGRFNPDNLIGYGEHLHIETALVYANEDYLARSRPNGAAFVPPGPRYITGTTLSTSNIDAWVYEEIGLELDWDCESGQVRCRLIGLNDSAGPSQPARKITKTGLGADIWLTFQAALAAEEVEVIKE